MVSAAEITFAGVMAGLFCLQLVFQDLGVWTSRLFWIVSAVFLAIALVFAFRALKHWQEKVSGVFCNETLMIVHEVAFLTATMFNVISFALTSTKKFDSDASLAEQ